MSDKNRFSDSSAKSYSQALYELATEEKNLNDVEEHAVSIIKLISQSEDFNRILNLKTLINVSENLSKEDININLLGGKPILKLKPQQSEIHLVKNDSLPYLNRIISIFYNNV